MNANQTLKIGLVNIHVQKELFCICTNCTHYSFCQLREKYNDKLFGIDLAKIVECSLKRP